MRKSPCSLKSAILKHGDSARRVYGIYRRMMRRCYDPSWDSWKWYGLKGITVCANWANSFESFIDDMGIPPSPKHSLDRKENSKGYSPENCRWSTQKEQCRNTTRTVWIEISGVTKSLPEWCETLGTCPKRAHKRLRNGWPPERAVSAPVGSTFLKRPKRESVKSTDRRERIILCDGVGKSLTDWAEAVGISTGTISARLRRGWSAKDAIFKPLSENWSRQPIK